MKVRFIRLPGIAVCPNAAPPLESLLPGCAGRTAKGRLRRCSNTRSAGLVFLAPIKRLGSKYELSHLTMQPSPIRHTQHIATTPNIDLGKNLAFHGKILGISYKIGHACSNINFRAPAFRHSSILISGFCAPHFFPHSGTTMSGQADCRAIAITGILG